MKANSVNLAIYVAISSIALFLLSAIIEGGMMLSFLFGTLAFVIILVLPIMMVRKERRENGGIISFKDGFMVSFLGLLVAGVVSTLFTYVYVSFVDPEYAERLAYKTMEFTKNMMEGNVPDEQVEETLRKIEADTAAGFTLLGMLKSFAIYLGLYAVLSAIIAAFLKKDSNFAEKEA